MLDFDSVIARIRSLLSYPRYISTPTRLHGFVHADADTLMVGCLAYGALPRTWIPWTRPNASLAGHGTRACYASHALYLGLGLGRLCSTVGTTSCTHIGAWCLLALERLSYLGGLCLTVGTASCTLTWLWGLLALEGLTRLFAGSRARALEQTASTQVSSRRALGAPFRGRALICGLGYSLWGRVPSSSPWSWGSGGYSLVSPFAGYVGVFASILGRLLRALFHSFPP